jgi:anti-sigma factor RsiW
MKCDEARNELVALSLGLVEAADRDAVEAHLAECSACVREFLAVKRAMESCDEESTEGPSELSRARLREAVAVELDVASAQRRWWERPLAIAVAACAVLGAGLTTNILTSGPGAPPHGVVLRAH